MKHCPACGAILEQKSATHFSCSACSDQHYINPKATVAIVLLKDAETVYLGVRAHEPARGKLDCLGGFLDIGENFEQALYRELEEEGGIKSNDLLDLQYLTSTYDPYPWQGDVVHTASVYFVAYLNPGVIVTPNDDVAEIKACDIANLDSKDFAWDGMAHAFSVLRELPSK